MKGLIGVKVGGMLELPRNISPLCLFSPVNKNWEGSDHSPSGQGIACVGVGAVFWNRIWGTRFKVFFFAVQGVVRFEFAAVSNMAVPRLQHHYE